MNQKSSISDFDITRKMLKIIREQQNNILEGYEEIDDIEFQKEKENFIGKVSPKVEFDKILINVKNHDVRWSGRFIDNNLEWSFNLIENDGIYIVTNLLQLNDNVLKIINKLCGFYKVWCNNWSKKIITEYNK